MGILASEVAILASVSMPNAHSYRALDASTDEGHKTQTKFCALKDNADYILAPKNPDLPGGQFYAYMEEVHQIQ